MKKVCQSCGMPIKDNSQLGHEKDGTVSKYCSFCYKDGEFVNPDMTVDEMRGFCIDVMQKEMNMPKFIAKLFTKNIYKLERWNQ